MNENERPRPPTDDASFTPDRMLPIHNDAHCPNLDRREAFGLNPPDYIDDFIAGAWDGWLDFRWVGKGAPSIPYSHGRAWGTKFRRNGSPW